MYKIVHTCEVSILNNSVSPFNIKMYYAVQTVTYYVSEYVIFAESRVLLFILSQYSIKLSYNKGWLEIMVFNYS